MIHQTKSTSSRSLVTVNTYLHRVVSEAWEASGIKRRYLPTGALPHADQFEVLMYVPPELNFQVAMWESTNDLPAHQMTMSPHSLSSLYKFQNQVGYDIQRDELELFSNWSWLPSRKTDLAVLFEFISFTEQTELDLWLVRYAQFIDAREVWYRQPPTSFKTSPHPPKPLRKRNTVCQEFWRGEAVSSVICTFVRNRIAYA